MIIQSKRVFCDDKITPKTLVIEDGIIKRILPYGLLKADKDYGDKLIMPGLIDIHNHGYLLGDNNDASEEWLSKWCHYLPSEGVTSTLATISTAPYAQLIASLKVIGNYIDEKKEGTAILGVYSEGPFIAADYRGAQSLENKLVPTQEIIDAFAKACHDHLRLVMLAPEELDEDMSIIEYLVKKGIRVTIGHSGATYDICNKAIAKGVTSFTHTYNGMRPLHHREPGVVGACMVNDDCFAEVICDGVHVHKGAANILARIKGKDKLIFVTDSVAIKGLKPGIYTNGERTSRVCEDGVARLEDGTIAGSANRLNKVLQFGIKEAKIDEVTCLRACTINPCLLLGVKDRGLLSEGLRADIVVFDDDFDVIDVYIEGEMYKFD